MLQNNAKIQLFNLKESGKITLSTGTHGLIFMQILNINSYNNAYPDYETALKHYDNYISNIQS